MSSNDTNLFFAPVSSGDLYDNFKKSIIEGVNVIDVKKHAENIFEQHKIVKLWGIRDAKKSTFLKTKPKDIVCFYKNGFIIGYGKVIKTFTNTELSEAIWGKFFNKLSNEYYLWRNIIWIEEFHECNVSFREFITQGEYDDKFSIRGYLMLNSIGKLKILKKHNSFEGYFNYLEIKKI